jgi:hypothetical protein
MMAKNNDIIGKGQTEMCCSCAIALFGNEESVGLIKWDQL